MGAFVTLAQFESVCLPLLWLPPGRRTVLCEWTIVALSFEKSEGCAPGSLVGERGRVLNVRATERILLRHIVGDGDVPRGITYYTK
jgi:hypothetical protein